MPHSTTTYPTILHRGGVGWCGLRSKQSTRALAFGRKWSTCVLQFASNNRNSYALAFARVLSIVFAGAHSPAPLLHQQLRDELLDAVDARLLEFPAFEVLCLSQVGVIDELVHTMARLRGGLPSQAPAAAASSIDDVLDQRGRFEAVFAIECVSSVCQVFVDCLFAIEWCLLECLLEWLLSCCRVCVKCVSIVSPTPR